MFYKYSVNLIYTDSVFKNKEVHCVVVLSIFLQLKGTDLCRSHHTSPADFQITPRPSRYYEVNQSFSLPCLLPLWPTWTEIAMLLAGLASELKPSLPTLALGNVTNAEKIQCGVWPLNTLLGTILIKQREMK